MAARESLSRLERLWGPVWTTLPLSSGMVASGQLLQQQLNAPGVLQQQAMPHQAPGQEALMLCAQTWTRGMLQSNSFSTSLLVQRAQEQQQQLQQQHLQGSTSAGHSLDHPAAAETTPGMAASVQLSWIDRRLPAFAAPYAHLMRLDKPIGTWLLLWPGLWSIALAADPTQLPNVWNTMLFSVGAILLRGAGCTINDLWDRHIDKRVERTRSRPLAAGKLSVPQAVAFLAAQLSLGLVILLQLNTYTQALGVASLGLVATYPLMKRITNWPQAYLGLTFNWGALMGYAAVRGYCEWHVVLPLYAAGVCWTLVYDTIYAHQDKKDDAQVGVRSTALHFGADTKHWLAGFATAQTALLVLAGSAAGCGLPYFAGVAAGSGHLAWQIRSVDLDNGKDCMDKFVSNRWYGALLYSGIVAQHALAAYGL